VELLRALEARLGFSPATTDQGEAPPAAWSAYALQSSRERVLTHLTALPLTREHDEFFFIRCLHLSECSLWGTLGGVMAALEKAKLGHLDAAAVCLAEAVSFAEGLQAVFQPLKKTLPPEHFMSFREATDGSSAIQSRTYQMLQIFTQGVDEVKVAPVSGIPEINDLLGYRHAGFLHLSALAETVAAQDVPGQGAFLAQVEALDKALYSWRRLHLGTVRRTLPPDVVGTGGTGVRYLESHVAHRIRTPQRTEAVSSDQPRAPRRRLRSVFSECN
jgi:tryptophan 2,3-dioxygenase